MKSKTSSPWPWLAIGALILIVVGGLGLLTIAATMAGGGGQIGLVELTGVIADAESGGVLGGGRTSQDFIDDLDRAQRDGSLKAVVIRINSPGGAAAASQEMFQAVERLREVKPVVCSMGDVAASGGYYVAAGCDKIYANGATLTGSIGVITQLLNYQELFNKLGLKTNTIKSGEFKDAGNPNRPLTAEERQLFQQMVMGIYEQFLDDVAQGRSRATQGRITKAKLRPLANGRVFTGVQAKQNGLVDELGGLHEAVLAAAKLGGVQGRPRVRKLSTSGLLGGLVQTEAQSTLARGAQLLGQAFAAGFINGIRSDSSSAPQPVLK